MSLSNIKIQIPSVRIYSDSDGNGPGKIVDAGIYYCNNYQKGKIAPIHISNNSGDLGWINCYYTGKILVANPPIYVCDSRESFAFC